MPTREGIEGAHLDAFATVIRAKVVSASSSRCLSLLAGTVARFLGGVKSIAASIGALWQGNGLTHMTRRPEDAFSRVESFKPRRATIWEMTRAISQAQACA